VVGSTEPRALPAILRGGCGLQSVVLAVASTRASCDHGFRARQNPVSKFLRPNPCIATFPESYNVPHDSIFGRSLPVNRHRFSNRESMLLAAGLTALSAGCASAPSDQPNLDATLWVQTAAEYGAVARSVYVAALDELPTLLADSTRSAALEQAGDFSALPPAVILDVDETVLDNSPYQARLLITGAPYSSDTWADWVDERVAEAVPGALEFTNGAADLGITVFYLTNRRSSQEQATRDNLGALGFPVETAFDVLLTRGEQPDWHGPKSGRRHVVASTHRVLMVVGDDLNDFVDVDGLTVAARNEVAQRYSEYWGEQWRMLPNPTYGSWERALFDSDYGLDPAERTGRKAEHLETRGENDE